MIALSSALIGYLADNCTIVERIILVAGGLLLIKPGLMTDAVGLVLFLCILFFQLRRKKAQKALAH